MSHVCVSDHAGQFSVEELERLDDGVALREFQDNSGAAVGGGASIGEIFADGAALRN